MSQALPAIGDVKDAHPAKIQKLFRELDDSWKSATQIYRMIEEGDDEACEPASGRHLVSVSDSSRFRMFQDLGAGSIACRIDPESLLSAGEAVRRQIERGCDLVILSKFARLEA